MANKEALRGLQARLAERLKQAQSQGVAASWLAVEAGERRFLFPLELSGEIFPYMPLHKVPHTVAWFAGVANLRGGLYGVADLSVFMGGASTMQRMALESAKQSARMVALNSALDVNCALLISGLVGLRNAGDFVRMEPAPAGAQPYLSNTYIDAQGVQWQELNLQALAQSPDFLTIAQ